MLPNRGISETWVVLSSHVWQIIEGVQLVKSHILMRRLAHPAVYTISTKWAIILTNESIIDIILLYVWHRISSLKFFFKRGQGRLLYILLLLRNRRCHVIY